MRDTKKNMTRTAIHRLFIAALLLTIGLGQVLAVDYSPYKGKKRTRGGIYSTAEAAKEAGGLPTMGFQSTSTMSGGTRSDAATPLVNGDGSVAGGAYFGAEPSGPQKAPGNGPGTPPIPDPDDQQVPTPIGNGIWVMLLMAMILMARIYTQKDKQIKDSTSK